MTDRGARRWARGHPWIYRTDVSREPRPPTAGIVAVVNVRDRFLGHALYSPRSEIRLRLLTNSRDAPDQMWWTARLREALARRDGIDATACRIVHAEGDGLPSLIVDRYGTVVVAQLLSAGLEAVRGDVLDAIRDVLAPSGLLLRHDARVREHEGLPQGVELAFGNVPEAVDVTEHGVHYRAAPWTGQKTGAFLDQRENRRLAGSRARGRVLDLFTYQGAFALHLARGAERVVAVDQSGDALRRGREHAALNRLSNVEWIEANAFDYLRSLERGHERFDVIVLDPPAFAKTKDRVPRALAGYKEINLRAMKLLSPGGILLTFSCSFHVGRDRFLAMASDAAGDARRQLVLEQVLGQAGDHPEALTIPETSYLKGLLLRAMD